MVEEVADLGEDPDTGETVLHVGVVGPVGSVRDVGAGTVDVPGEEDSGEEPVVCRVLEDVEDGHGRRGEAVEEDAFELALEEVEGGENHEEGLSGGSLGDGGEVGVEVGAGEVEEGVDDERAEVFDNEDGAPANLRTWISISLTALGSGGRATHQGP